MRSRAGSSCGCRAGPAGGLVGREPGRLEDRGIGQSRVAGRTRDPAPVRVAAVGRRLDEAGRDDRAGHGPRLGVVGRTGHHGRDQRRGALAVGGLLPGEVAGDGLDRRPEDRGLADCRRGPAPPRTPRTRGRTRCRWCSCRRRRSAGPRCAPRRAAAVPTASRARRPRRSARPRASWPSAGGSSRRPSRCR